MKSVFWIFRLLGIEVALRVLLTQRKRCMIACDLLAVYADSDIDIGHASHLNLACQSYANIVKSVLFLTLTFLRPPGLARLPFACD